MSSNGGKKQRFTFGKQLDNGAGVLLSASAFDSDGQNLYFPAYDTPQTNQGLAQNQDSERARRIFGKYTFEGLTVEGAYVDREKMVPTNPNPYTAFNRPFSIQDENAFLNIRYETDIGLKLHSASRLYQGAYAYNATREFADDSDGEKYGLRQFEGRWWGLEQKFVGNWFTDHAIVFGLESVSYTHLDVYKRQARHCTILAMRRSILAKSSMLMVAAMASPPGNLLASDSIAAGA